MYCIICKTGFRVGDKIVKVVSARISEESLNCFEYDNERDNCEMHIDCFNELLEQKKDIPSVERTDSLSVFNF